MNFINENLEFSLFMERGVWDFRIYSGKFWIMSCERDELVTFQNSFLLAIGLIIVYFKRITSPIFRNK